MVLSSGTVKQVHQIMTSKMVMMPQSTTLSETATRMEAESVSSILLEENGIPVGILTERDILRALGQSISLDVSADKLMTRGLISVNANETIHAAFHCMVVNSIRHLVVLDENSKAVGILSETDFRKSRGVENFVGPIDVAHAMSQSYVAVSKELTVGESARLMQQRKSSCALVLVDDRPIGIVTERDMVRLFRTESSSLPMYNVMTSPVATVTPNLLLVDAVRQMQQQRIRRLIIVDGDGKLCGILNEHDVVRHLEDEYVQMLQQLVVQQAQALSEDKFRAVVDTVPDKIMLKDREGKYISCNASYAADLGIHPREIVGKNDFDYFPSELAERYRSDDQAVINTGLAVTIEEPYLTNNEQAWIRTTKAPMRDKQGAIKGVVVVFHDITERKRYLDELQHRTWALEALSKCNDSLLRAKTEEQMWNDICTAITSNDRYPLAWVGWVERNEAQNVRLLAFAGHAKAALKNFRASWGDNEYGNELAALAIRTGLEQLSETLTSKPDSEAWSIQYEKFDLASCLALPIIIDRQVTGVMVVYSSNTGVFNEAVTKLFREMVNNIIYGICTLRQKIDYHALLDQQTNQSMKLEQSLESTLSAIAATLEQRDPYTAGHQKHVADLATMIGIEMGLGSDILKGLYLAGIVHDLGKIHIPSEILTKPGRLIRAEFALVKSHPEVGYNILKTIEFPWPIADIVRQHHEYLDGSGYPQGLKENQILLQAKILTVADIVESMSADRPYRPALGIESAMIEIQRLSDSKLDKQVVKACIALLQRGDFIPSQLHLSEG